MDFLKNNAVAVIALVVAILGCYFPVSSAVQQGFGGITNYDEVDASAMRIGSGCNNGMGSSCTGSRIGGVFAGTAILIASNYTSLAASTSLAFDIATPGVVSGDIVMAEFATSSAAMLGSGWLITGSSASTTSGFSTLTVVNNTGTTRTIPASIASTTEYEAIHPLSAAPGL